MQKPARLGRLAIKALAVKPVAAAFNVLNAKIIADRRRYIFMPPFGGDALRPFGPRHAIKSLAPAEGKRRAFRNFCRSFDRFGPLQKPDRAGARWRPVMGRSRFRRLVEGIVSQGREATSAFGHMAFSHERSQNSIAPQARTNAIGEEGKIPFLSARLPGKISLRRGEGHGNSNGKPQQIESVARVEVVLERRQPLMKKPGDSLRLTQWTRRAHHDARHGTIDPEKRQGQTPRALPAPFQILFQRLGKQQKQSFDIFKRDNRFSQPALDRKRRNRQARRNGFFDNSQGLIQPGHELTPETA